MKALCSRVTDIVSAYPAYLVRLFAVFVMLACNATANAAGFITVNHVTSPSIDQSFEYFATGGLDPTSFNLNNDVGVGPDFITIPVEIAGTYRISVTPSPNHDTSIACISGLSTTQVAGNEVEISFIQDDNVTCTFTHTSIGGSITIRNETIPQSPQVFSYSTSTNLGPVDFELDDDPASVLENSRLFSNLPPGTYTVDVTGVAAYDTLVDCDDPSDDTSTTATSAIISLGSEEVTCTFSHTKMPTDFPEIEVVSSLTGPVADNGSISHGAVNSGALQSIVYTIQNTGQALLALGPPVLSNVVSGSQGGSTNLDDTATSLFLAPGQTTSFTVDYQNDGSGPFSFEITIPNNDPDENPFDFTVSGTVAGAPEIEVTSSVSGPVADGAIDSQGNQRTGAAKQVTYTVTNTGSDILTLVGTPSATNLNNVAAPVISPPALPALLPGATTSFSVTYTPLNDGAFSFDLDVVSNDGDENPYDIRLEGTALSPEIDISSSVSGNISDGGTDSQGVVLSMAARTITYTVTNIGTDTLVLAGTPSVSNVVNVSAPMVTTPTSLSLVPGGSASFSVSFTPQASGPFSFDLDVLSNDSNESPYDIKVSGLVGTPDILISSSVSGAVGDGATDAQGNQLFGVAKQIEYTITNAGTDTLTLAGAPTASNLVNVAAPAIAAPANPSLAPNASTTFTVTYTPISAGVFSFDLDVLSNDPDENPHDIAVVGIAPAIADLSVSIDDNVSMVGPGGSIVYDITVANSGPSPDPAVALTTNLSSVLSCTYTSTASAGASGNTAAGSGSLSEALSMPVGSSVAYRMTCMVNATAFGTLLSQATVTPSVGDAFTANNLATDSDTQIIPPKPEIAIVSSVSGAVSDGGTEVLINSQPGVARQITYTITNSGSGNLTLGGTPTASQLFNVPTPVITAPGSLSLAPNASTTFTVTFTPQTGQLGFGFDINVISNDDDENPYNFSVGGVLPTPEITVIVSAPAGKPTSQIGLVNDDTTISIGSHFLGLTETLPITVSNEGTGTLNLTPTPTVSNLVNLDSITVSAPSTTALAPQASVDFNVTYGAKTAGAFSFDLDILSNDADENPFDIRVEGAGVAWPDIAVTASSNQNDVPTTGAVIYDLDITNVGTATATGISFDTLITGPSCTFTSTATGGATGNTVTGTPGSAANPGGSILQILTMPAGSNVAYKLTCDLASVPETMSSISVSSRAVTSGDINAANDQASVVHPVIRPAEIAIHSSVNSTMVDGGVDGQVNLQAGTSRTITYTVINHATSATLNLIGTPTASDLVNVSAPVITAPTSSALGPGGQATFTVTYTPLVPGAFSFDLDVASNDADENPFDIKVFGNAVGQADISVTKTDNLTQVFNSASLTYRIMVSNAGPVADPAVRLVDNVPSSLENCTYTSSAVGGATGNTASGSGNLGETLSMPVGSAVTYQLTCAVAASASGTLSNTATASASVVDPNSSNNSATDNDTAIIGQGTIEVKVESNPSSPTDFEFTTTGGLTPTTFSLDDDSLSDPDASLLAKSRTFNSVLAGQYTITQKPAAGHNTVLACADSDGGTTVSGLIANIDLDAGEQIVCIFTSIENVKPVPTITGVPAIVSRPFTATITFSENVNNFDENDVIVVNGTKSQVTTITPQRVYTIDITPVAEGTVAIDIRAGAAIDQAGNDSVAAAQVTTSFQNAAPQATISGLPGTAGGAFTATISFDEEVNGFDASDIVATNAQLSAFATIVSRRSFTILVTPVADGPVSVRIPAGSATDSLGKANPESEATTTFDGTAPTVTILNAPASHDQSTPFTITIQFSEDLPAGAFEQSDITVVNATLSNFAAVNKRTFTVDVTPTGPKDITIDVVSGVAQDIAGNANLQATPVGVPSNIVEATSERIQNFIRSRSGHVLANQPNLGQFVTGSTFTGGGPLGYVGINGNELNQSYAFGTSRGHIADWVRRSDQALLGGGQPAHPDNANTFPTMLSGYGFFERPEYEGNRIARTRSQTNHERVIAAHEALLNGQDDTEVRSATASPETLDQAISFGNNEEALHVREGTPSRTATWDIWTQIYGAIANAGTSTSSLWVGYAGAHYFLSENAIAGVIGQLDWASETNSATNSNAEGSGWMIGPYLAGKAPNQPLFYELRGAWGRSSNRISPIGTFSDTFDTTRWLVSGKVSGSMQVESLTVSPSVSVIYWQETQESYVDSLGNAIPEFTQRLGEIRFGPSISSNWDFGDGLIIHPSLGVSGVLNFAVDNDDNAQGFSLGNGDLRARLDAGITVSNADGATILFTGFYDGIGVADYDAFGGTIRLTIPLN